jgi:hypothetical protein
LQDRQAVAPRNVALAYLVDHDLDMLALDASCRNEITGASTVDPCVMLKIVKLHAAGPP